MLRVERKGKRLTGFGSLQSKPLSDVYDLADFLVNSSEAFFSEIGEDLFFLGADVETAPHSSRADLLAVDRTGALVVVMVETDPAGSALARSMAAAGHASTWGEDDVWRRLTPARAAELKRFLAGSASRLNHAQRIVLVAEKAHRDALSTAGWLSGKYRVDVTCVEVELAFDPQTGSEFLRCTQADLPTSTAAPAPEPFRPAKAAAASAGPPGERRSSQREPSRVSDLQVWYAGRELAARAVDQSENGLGLEMNSPLPLDSAIRVRANLGGETNPGPIDRNARVKHCRFGHKTFRIGVAFD